jgi:hypothetical protein
MRNKLLAAFAMFFLMQSAYAATVLLVDTVKVENESRVMQRIRTQALAAQQRKTPGAKALNGAYLDALDQSLSDIRAAIPRVIASVAKTSKADVVLEPGVAKKMGLTGVDVSSQIIQKIDAQFTRAEFISP